MKLLHEFTRLRLRGRLLLANGRRARACSYVVTVPAPLGRLAVAPAQSMVALPLPVVADNDTQPPLRLAGNQ